jgi:hypothetical protein
MGLTLLASAGSAQPLAPSAQPGDRGLAIVNEMIRTIRQDIHALEMTQKKWERIDGEMYVEKNQIKLAKDPYRVYINQRHPDEDVEVLYKEGENNGKAVVSPGNWIPTVKLDPNSSRMRKNQHHTVKSAGFEMVADILDYLLNQYSGEAAQLVDFQGKGLWNDRKVQKVVLENPDFGFTNYRVKAGENLIDIAKRKRVSEYMIMTRNSGVNDYWDVEGGQVIRIPTAYAKKTVLYIDMERNVPIKTLIYDDRGLFERYDALELTLNPDFASSEFSQDYGQYNF